MPQDNIRIRVLMLVLLMCLLLPTWANAQDAGTRNPIIATGHPDYPPFTWRDGDHIIGVGADLAAIILSRLNQPYENSYVGPWKRVQELARQGKIDMIVAIYRNQEREAYLDFSEPYCEDPTAVFTPKEKPFVIRDRRNLAGRRGVTLFGDSFGEDLDLFIEKELRMIRVYSVEEVFDLLLTGKADYLLFGYYAGLINASRLGVEEKITAIKKDLVVENFYFAFSEKSPYASLLPEINRQIRRLRQEGRIDDLITKHLKRSRDK